MRTGEERLALRDHAGCMQVLGAMFEHHAPDAVERAVRQIQAWSGNVLTHRTDGSPQERPDG